MENVETFRLDARSPPLGTSEALLLGELLFSPLLAKTKRLSRQEPLKAKVTRNIFFFISYNCFYRMVLLADRLLVELINRHIFTKD